MTFLKAPSSSCDFSIMKKLRESSVEQNLTDHLFRLTNTQTNNSTQSHTANRVMLIWTLWACSLLNISYISLGYFNQCVARPSVCRNCIIKHQHTSSNNTDSCRQLHACSFVSCNFKNCRVSGLMVHYYQLKAGCWTGPLRQSRDKKEKVPATTQENMIISLFR